MAQTFKEAFAAARKAGKTTFVWNGGSYNTKTKEETAGASRPKTRSGSTNPTSSPRPNTRSKQAARPATAATKASDNSSSTSTTSSRSTGSSRSSSSTSSEPTMAQKRAMIEADTGRRASRGMSPGARRVIDAQASRIAKKNKGR